MTNRTRKNQVKVYLDDKEKAKLEKLITRSKLTKSEYIRKSILEKEIIVVDDIKELVKQLKAVGNNLNQLTKIANTERQFQELEPIKSDLNQVWKEVINALKKVNK